MDQPNILIQPRTALVQSSDSSDGHAPVSPDSDQDNPYMEIARNAVFQTVDFDLWKIERTSGHGGDWIRIGHTSASIPQQGWKLHISASISSAEEVLSRALAVLLSTPTQFKFAADQLALLGLNQGTGGQSQIGKFITIYPQDDEQLRYLAPLLDEAVAGLSGPSIPSDRPIRAGSLVHYRYGAFSGRFTQLPYGEVVPAIEAPDGTLVADRRLTHFNAPDWAVDPFASGTSAEAPASKRWIAGRYLVLSNLHTSSRGSVYLALHFERHRCCILKCAPQNAAQSLDGYSAQDRLRNEARVLQQLAGHPGFPEFYELLEHQGDLYLAMEDIAGDTLMLHVNRESITGIPVPTEKIVEWGVSIASLLGHLHSLGLVYRDVKPTNVLITPVGQLRLIDLELCLPFDSEIVVAAGIGTRGYLSPQQTAKERPAFSDDIYALGALLYFLATCAEPSMSHNANLLARPIEWINAQADPALIRVIARCLDPDPAHRYSTMQQLADDLSAIVPSTSPLCCPIEPNSSAHYRALASRLADSICDEAVETPRGGLAWTTGHPIGHHLQLRDINIGSAGIIIALAALVEELGTPEHRAALERAAVHLSRTQPLARNPLPGLYVGEAGVALALLRAGQALGNSTFIDEAISIGRQVALIPHSSPDLFNGTAGRLLFHLWLYEATQDSAQLQAAIEAGDYLLASATSPAEDEMFWEIPVGFEGLSGNVYLGYAHGAAGIGDALLDLYRATSQGRFLDAALATARWLHRQSMPSLVDGAGLSWPSTPGGPPASPFWCHGSTGIARFFLKLADTAPGAFPEALPTAERAAQTVINASRWSGTTVCHGLAGNIELLLDMYLSTQNEAYLSEARNLARILETMSTERHANLVWPSDSVGVITPDYMVGYSGVAVVLLRLSDPACTPHLL